MMPAGYAEVVRDGILRKVTTAQGGAPATFSCEPNWYPGAWVVCASGLLGGRCGLCVCVCACVCVCVCVCVCARVCSKPWVAASNVHTQTEGPRGCFLPLLSCRRGAALCHAHGLHVSRAVPRRPCTNPSRL